MRARACVCVCVCVFADMFARVFNVILKPFDVFKIEIFNMNDVNLLL